MLRLGGYYHPHFIDDEAENQRLRVSPGLKSATRTCALFYNQLINLSALGLSYRTWNLPLKCMDSLVVVPNPNPSLYPNPCAVFTEPHTLSPSESLN